MLGGVGDPTEGWTVTVERKEGAASLAEALHALIAERADAVGSSAAHHVLPGATS